MPNSATTQTAYFDTGNPATFNSATLYAGGQLGQVYDANGNTFQTVKGDSGMTAATPTGVVAAGDLAFWKDRANYLVTNDSRAVTGFRNEVAGVFRTTVTAGYYCTVQQRGNAVSVASDASGANGDVAVANSGTAADVAAVAAGTAPTYIPVGIIRGAASGGFIAVDLNVPSIG